MKYAAIGALLAVLLSGCRNDVPDPINTLCGGALAWVVTPEFLKTHRGEKFKIDVIPLPGGGEQCVLTRTT